MGVKVSHTRIQNDPYASGDPFARDNLNAQVSQVLDHPEQRAQLIAIFNKCDKDGNGVLTREEFQGLGDALYHRAVVDQDELKRSNQREAAGNGPLRGVAAVNDANAHGLNEQKVRDDHRYAGPAIQQYINDMFAFADKDNTGYLTFEEFENFIKYHSATINQNKEPRKEENARNPPAGEKRPMFQMKGNAAFKNSHPHTAQGRERAKKQQYQQAADREERLHGLYPKAGGYTCPGCQVSNDANARFCQGCGASRENPQNTTPPNQGYPPQNASYPPAPGY